jgi:hypothetical protein
MTPATEATIGGYAGVGLAPAAAAFAREVVGAAAPAGPARARSLLWACSRLAGWGLAAGLEARPEVLLHPSVIERFATVGMVGRPPGARRTARANLRFVAARNGVAHPPLPVAWPRSPVKAPYTAGEVAAYLSWAAAQPTPARRQRLTALLCLGLGAGLERDDLRHVTGRHVAGGGVTVAVEGRRARVVPVLARYRAPLAAAAAFAGDGLICGGVSAARKNVTSNIIAKLSGGDDLPRLDVGRLRATWLCEHLDRLGLHALLAAAGVVCSQRLGQLARHLGPVDEATLIAWLS